MRRTPQSSAWLPRHLHKYSLNIGLSVFDFPGECVYLFVLAMGEGDLTGTILRFFERISYVASTGLERKEAHLELDQPLQEAMVLLDKIVEIVTLS